MTVNTSQTAPGAVRQYTCPWCGAVSDGTQSTCPSCGASVSIQARIDDAGWTQAPGSKDMARLQFGHSDCQVEGVYVPVADVGLAQGDSVYFAHHVLLWKDTQVTISTMSIKGAWKRMLAGMPVIMTQAHGPGHIAFSRDAPGEMVALPLQHGQSVDVREHIFVVATGQVQYDYFQTNIWLRTRKEGSDNETEMHYPIGMYMDRFSAPQVPGLVLLHASGNVFVRTLAAGQMILVKPTAMLYKDHTVQMQLHFEHPNGLGFLTGMMGPNLSVSVNLGGALGMLNSLGQMGDLIASYGQRYIWLALTGPGRVAIQSASESIEGESAYIVGCSSATHHRW